MPDLESSPAASPPRAWAEINLAHLRHNLEVVNSHQPGDVMAVLKAGAYGHGMEEIAGCSFGHPVKEKFQTSS